MGLIDLVPDLESPDPSTRFKAVTALYKMGPAAAPAVPKLVPLLRDLDGVNVKMTDGSERMIPIAERASMALAAIGEPAAGGVVEELKRDNAVSAIHCVRVLATPLLAKRAPVAVIGERLMRPKVSVTMATALCEVLSQILVSGDESAKTVARMSLTAGLAAGKVPSKYQALLSSAPKAAPQPPAPAAPAAKAAEPDGWMNVNARVSEAPAVKPPPPKPPPAPEPEVFRPAASAPPGRVSSIDRPTSITSSVATPASDIGPSVEDLRGRTIERPAAPHFDPVPSGAPTATYQPDVVFEMQQRVPPFAPPPPRAPAAPYVPLAYEAGDRFAYRNEIDQLLKKGDKLGAVKLLRSKTGASLVEALGQIESWC